MYLLIVCIDLAVSSFACCILMVSCEGRVRVSGLCYYVLTPGFVFKMVGYLELNCNKACFPLFLVL